MRVENEKFEVIEKIKEKLYHVHIANSNGRIYPQDESEDEYKSFFEILKRVGYDKRISIEARLIEKSDYEKALRVLKKLS